MNSFQDYKNELQQKKVKKKSPCRNCGEKNYCKSPFECREYREWRKGK